MDGQTDRQTSNISKNVNNSLCTNPTTLMVRSLVSEFLTKNLNLIFFFLGGGGGGGGGGG